MNQKNNYNFPAEEIRQELKRKKGIVNIIVPENADTAQKMKYSVSQSILTYQQATKKTFAKLAQETGIASLTEKKMIELCRGKLDNFSLGELVIYANNLGITSILCYDCGVELFPSLLEALILSLKDQEILSTKNLNIYKHQLLAH